MDDPLPVGTDCQPGPGPADAGALAESIRSDPGLQATAPVAVSVGGAEALMIDVMLPAGASICTTVDPSLGENIGGESLGLMALVFNNDTDVHDGVATGRATGEWMRLYLFDAPEGLSMRILAIAIVAPESRFERAVEAAEPVIDSVEFRAP